MNEQLTMILKNTILSLQKGGKSTDEIVEFVLTQDLFKDFHPIIMMLKEVDVPNDEILNNLINEKIFVGKGTIYDRTNQELVDEYLQHIRDERSIHTANSYKTPLTRYLNFLGERSVLEITYGQAKAFLDEIRNSKGRIRERAGDESYNTHLAALSGFYKFLKENNVFNGNDIFKQFKRIKQNTIKGTQQRGFTDKEIQHLHTTLETMNFKPLTRARTRFLLTLFLNVGMRRSDAWKLKVGSLDFETMSYKFNTSKTGIEVDPRLGKLLKKHYDLYLIEREKVMKRHGETHDALFVQQDGTPLSLDRLGDSLKDLYVASGLIQKEERGAKCHILRHTLGHRMQRNGETSLAIAKALGHASSKTAEDFYTTNEPTSNHVAMIDRMEEELIPKELRTSDDETKQPA